MAKPLGILLISGGHERAHYALVLATGAAALGRDVTLFATNAGCRLFLADPPLLRDPREAALAARGVAGLATLLDAAGDLGIRLHRLRGGAAGGGPQPGAVAAPDMMVAGVATFLGAVGEGQIVTV